MPIGKEMGNKFAGHKNPNFFPLSWQIKSDKSDFCVKFVLLIQMFSIGKVFFFADSEAIKKQMKWKIFPITTARKTKIKLSTHTTREKN